MSEMLIFLLNIYKRYISPMLPASCRFEPTCSVYSMQAIKKYGFLKGTYLSIWRIMRCNPFSKGGFDPVK
ncbi:MAG: membrane protein insertion efficiency factor YidD [Actinobacteria bacterium]|nr:membrane protein insertion efficiency factor YidD [Actinomycetota bacterium]